jgi:hypothetical protein
MSTAIAKNLMAEMKLIQCIECGLDKHESLSPSSVVVFSVVVKDPRK